VHDLQLLVLDEPFSGLDPGGIDAMSAILAERAASGVTVLSSTSSTWWRTSARRSRSSTAAAWW
jgi:ABC-type multidrug transport system ATPase subunit